MFTVGSQEFYDYIADQQEVVATMADEHDNFFYDKREDGSYVHIHRGGSIFEDTPLELDQRECFEEFLEEEFEAFLKESGDNS